MDSEKLRLEELLDDEGWNEVAYVNTYAVFMGYLSMAIKGLGFIVLTWTTVVLLGGYVSMLHKKDFWALTFITLAQTAGIFDVALNEKLRYILIATCGFRRAVCWGVVGSPDQHGPLASCALCYLVGVLIVLQVVVLGPVLCSLAIVYVFGILMSGGVSLWRLIEHDYSDSNGEASNLAPAMDTLYYLSLLQSVLFCYRFVLGFSGKRLAKIAATKCDGSELKLVSNYLKETRNGCEKDPSFAKGRNLITHAMDMILSNSPLDCISGVKILYTTIRIVENQLQQLEQDDEKDEEEYRIQKDILCGQRMLMKHLVLSSASSKHILQKLLEMLDSRGLHYRCTRNQAAKIVECLALNINLEDFTRGIQHISSLIGTFEQYSVIRPFERDSLYDEYEKLHVTYSVCTTEDQNVRNSYKELLLQGLCIIRKLATDENNCRVISHTRDLVSKIMAPVTSDLLKHTTDDHGAWFDIVKESIEVMRQLTNAPGETGAKLRLEISRCQKTIATLWRILNCKKCNEGLQRSAIWILTQLYMDTEKTKYMDTESSTRADSVVLNEESIKRADFVGTLLKIFIGYNSYSSSIRGDAGGSLSEICFRGGITLVIQIGSGVAQSLNNVLESDENKKCRQHAAEILEHLCTHYTENDEYPVELKNVMTTVMPEVIEELLRCVEEAHTGIYKFPKPKTGTRNRRDNGRGKGISTSSSSHPRNDDKNKEKVLQVLGEETHKEKKVGQVTFAKPKTDIESQCDNGRGKGTSSCSSNQPQKDEQGKEKESFGSITLLSSFLSLCAMVYDKFISKVGPDLPPQLEASSIVNMNIILFADKLKEILLAERSCKQVVEYLLLCKAIANMVISLMKHGGGRSIKQENLVSLVNALSSASKNMVDLDYSMVFSSADSSSATTSSKLNRCTLASLVKEAQELLANMPSTSSTAASG